MWRLCTPFLYFLDTRVRSRGERLAWLSTYVVPVCLMAAAAVPSDPWVAAVAAAIGVVAVYAAYEYGYMVNDSVTVLTEERPTLRLPAERLDQVRRALPRVLLVRMLIVAAAALLVHGLVGRHGADAAGAASVVLVLGVGIVLWYAVYNRVRSHASIVLFLVLVGARCVGPVAVALAGAGALTPAVALLLAVYALPNTIEFAAKPKYRLGWLRPVAAGVDVWRVAYYTLACAATAVVVWADAGPDGAIGRALIAGLLYFLVYRTLIVLGPARRWRRT